MTALIIISAIIVYIAIGCTINIFTVRCGWVDPTYSNYEEIIFSTIFLWPLLGPLLVIVVGIEKLIDYLRTIKRKK